MHYYCMPICTANHTERDPRLPLSVLPSAHPLLPSLPPPPPADVRCFHINCGGTIRLTCFFVRVFLLVDCCIFFVFCSLWFCVCVCFFLGAWRSVGVDIFFCFLFVFVIFLVLSWEICVPIFRVAKKTYPTLCGEED